MLQMRPRKMSLLLRGNNNSKFQLLLTLQSSMFSSDRNLLCGRKQNMLLLIDSSFNSTFPGASHTKPPFLLYIYYFVFSHSLFTFPSLHKPRFRLGFFPPQGLLMAGECALTPQTTLLHHRFSQIASSFLEIKFHHWSSPLTPIPKTLWEISVDTQMFTFFIPAPLTFRHNKILGLGDCRKGYN